MNRLALGTVQFGLDYGIANLTGQVTQLAAKEMLELASLSGIDTLDTAIAYGESETCLGNVGIQRCKLITKLPPLPEKCPNVIDWIEEQVSASLARLGVTNIYGLLLHRPEQLLGGQGHAIYKGLQGLKRRGQVRKIGVSIYSPAELDALTKHFRFDLVQAPFSLLDRRMLTSGWLQRLKNANVEIHTRSAFLQGLLLMPESEIPNRFLAWSSVWQQWHAWLEINGVSALHACLAYPLSFPEIDRVVVGADSTNQLAQIIDAVKNLRALEFPDIHCEDEKLINPSNWAIE